MKPTSDPAVQTDVPGPTQPRVRGWRVLMLGCLAAIAVLAWMPGHPLPLSTPSDKLNHLLAFSALGFLAWRAYPGRRAPAFLALLGFGMLIELVQWHLPTRSAEWADLLADSLGLVVGATVGAATRRWAQRA